MTATNDRHIPLSVRAPTSTKLQLSDSNTNLVLGLRRGMTLRLTDSHNLTLASSYSVVRWQPAGSGISTEAEKSFFGASTGQQLVKT